MCLFMFTPGYKWVKADTCWLKSGTASSTQKVGRIKKNNFWSYTPFIYVCTLVKYKTL